jgi:spore germination cell wall hydrolase CwlJ-like protein
MRRYLAAALACALLIATSTAARAAGSKPDPTAVRVLALNMYHEAKGEGRRGMLAVGWVVLNRMADEAFPKSVEGVVYQGCQFSWVCDDRADEPTGRNAWRTAMQLATELLTEPPADPTRGALWFNGAAVGHTELGSRVAAATRIGNHLFYTRTDRLPKPAPKPYHKVMYASR